MDADILNHHVYFSVLCGLFVLGLVIELIRRRRLQERYAVLWIVVALVFITYGLWIDQAGIIAHWFRIDDPVTVVLFFGIFLCVLLLLQVFLKISEFSIVIKNLIQEVSMLKYELERSKSKETAKIGGEDIRPDSSRDYEKADAE